MFVSYLFVVSKRNNGTTKSLNAIRIAFLTATNLSAQSTLFLSIVLCAERFACIYFCLRYQEIVTHKRVVAVVV